jgi:hypothetical protein
MRLCLTCFLLALLGCHTSPDEASDSEVTGLRDVRPATQSTEMPAAEGVDSSIFVEMTKECGIDFVHFNGTTGEYFVPEITGSGGALFDYDNDGDLDLYSVQGAVLMPDRGSSPSHNPDQETLRDRLYRNDLATDGSRGLRFTDVTSASGITAYGYGMGVATGDFNNDGWIDLYVTNLGPNQLLRNNGDGTFSDVTEKCGANDPRWSTSASFCDYDGDGWLDIFVANYVDFSIHMKRECFSPSSARDYCGPDSYEAVPDRLLHNKGDGTFEDVTAAAGISTAFGAGLGVIAADFNGDGRTDIFVANDGDPNQLWINQQDSGKFVDDALLSGIAVNGMGQAEASMGVDAADFDGDGDEDVFMTHISQESNTFYVNLGNGLFDDQTIRVGLHLPSLCYTAFGTRFFDYDNDGWLDLLVLNGAVTIIESLADKGDPYPLHQPNQLFRNDGGSGFVEATQQAGPAFEVSDVSRGTALGDVDNDGDSDVVVFNNNGRARLLLNQVGNRQHWLGLRLLESSGTRDSFQARIEVLGAREKTLWRRVRTDGSYCCGSDPRVLIGLGDRATPCTVRVHWPAGQIEQWNDLAPDRYWVLRQGRANDAHGL